ncbi:MAG TPA: hypothetical protein VIC60_03085, partial [Thermomicrobiales bacterium]
MPGAGRRKVVAQRRLLAPSPDEKRRLEEWRGQIAHNIPQPDTGFRAMMRHHYTRMARLSLNRVGNPLPAVAPFVVVLPDVAELDAEGGI